MNSSEESPESVGNSATEEEPEAATSAIGRSAAVALLLLFIGGTVEAFSLGVGSPANPGPGLWPVFISVVGAALSLVLVILGTSWLPSEIGTYRWSAIMALAICGYMVALPFLGFLIATALLCLIVTRVLGQARWITVVATSVLAPLLSYFVFNQVLGVPAIGPNLF